MSHIPFHLTRDGRRFFESHVPELLRLLDRLNRTLEKLEGKGSAEWPDRPRGAGGSQAGDGPSTGAEPQDPQ